MNPIGREKVVELVGALRSRQRRLQLTAVRRLHELLVVSTELQRSLEEGRTPQGPGALPEMRLHGVFLAAGGMQAAVRLLSSNVSKAEVAGLLGSACVTPAAADELAAAGGVEPLVQLLRSTAAPDGSETRSAALGALADAAKSSDAVQDAAVAAGCVPLLVDLIQGPADFDFVSGTAVWMLGMLALRHQDALLASGAVQALVQLLPQPPLAGAALKALNRLTFLVGSRPRLAKVAAAIAAAGGIAAAVQCLRGEGAPDWPSTEVEFTVPQLAAGLLGDLAAAGPELVAEVQAAGAVPRLEYMLRHCTNAAERGWAATALVSIRRAAAAAAEAASQPARPRRICAAPGCSNTQGLKRCGGCRSVRYCSRECCKAHWPEHKTECRRLQAEAAAAAAADAEAADGRNESA